jgi:hypothetical protein
MRTNGLTRQYLVGKEQISMENICQDFQWPSTQQRQDMLSPQSEDVCPSQENGMALLPAVQSWSRGCGVVADVHLHFSVQHGAVGYRKTAVIRNGGGCIGSTSNS